MVGVLSRAKNEPSYGVRVPACRDVDVDEGLAKESAACP